MVITIIIFMTA